MERIRIPKSEFQPYATWSDKCYTRNCIIENEYYELLLLCWKQGQKTPIHNHGGQECWVYIASGELQECLYENQGNTDLKCVKQITRREGDISYMNDALGYHSLSPISETLMTLHLYANPIASCMCFDQSKSQFVNKILRSKKREEK